MHTFIQEKSSKEVENFENPRQFAKVVQLKSLREEKNLQTF